MYWEETRRKEPLNTGISGLDLSCGVSTSFHGSRPTQSGTGLTRFVHLTETRTYSRPRRRM